MPPFFELASSESSPNFQIKLSKSVVSPKQKSPTPFGVGLSWQITVIMIQNQNEFFCDEPPLLYRGFIFIFGGRLWFRGFTNRGTSFSVNQHDLSNILHSDHNFHKYQVVLQAFFQA